MPKHPLRDDLSTGGPAWFAAPDESHVWGWRFLDARLFDPVLSVSYLMVRFKDKAGGIAAEYWYYVPDPDEGQRLADAMRASPHPYGHVLYPTVVKPKLYEYDPIFRA